MGSFIFKWYVGKILKSNRNGGAMKAAVPHTMVKMLQLIGASSVDVPAIVDC